MKLIVGLGNPGKKYEKTRHNIGFDCIDRCANKLNISLTESKFKGVFGSTVIQSEKVFLLKPLTFMNVSGESVQALANFYKIEPKNILVIYDDLDLPVGKIRLRKKGSAGGHNGMKSIISHLGTEDFKRIRVGIGRPQRGEPVVNYVLGSFRPSERELVAESIEQTAKAVEAWTATSFDEVMNTYN